MTVEDLKRVVWDGDPAKLDTPEMTELIEGMSLREVTALENDDGFAKRVTAPIETLSDSLNSSFVQRHELIEIALASFLVQIPMIALGPPGTAKSAVLRKLADLLGLRPSPERIDQVKEEMLALLKRDSAKKGVATSPPQRRYFEYLVTRFTTADEILGPPHLDLMISHALFYRQSAGLLPEAHVAFLDEVFKANSAILNALLSIMNERLFYNAGRAAKIPLCMVFGASNEPPPDQELNALYDRFPIRVMCNPVQDEKDALLETLRRTKDGQLSDVFGEAARRSGEQEQEKKEKQGANSSQIASVNHLRLMFRLLLAREKRWQDDYSNDAANFTKAFLDTFRVFRREFQISDRSMARFYSLAQGLAILRKRKHPGTKELEVFKYCFRDMEAAAALADAVDDRVLRR